MPQSRTKTGKLNKKSKPIGMLYPDPSHKQGHRKTQNKGLVEDLSIKWRAKNKEGHYIMVKGSMQQQESMIINIYAPNIGTPRYVRQVLNDLKRDLDSHAIIAGDFYTTLLIFDRSTR